MTVPVIICSDLILFSLSKIVASDAEFYLAEAAGGCEDDIIHNTKECHHASLQIISLVALDGGKCSLVFMEDKERLNAATYAT